MDDFLEYINMNIRLKAEHYIALYYFKFILDETIRLSYEDFIIYDSLVNRFNTRSEEESQVLENLLNVNKDKVDTFITNFNATPWIYAKPIIWGDRNRSEYYINNLTASHRFEKYIERMFEERGIDLGLYYGMNGQYDQGETALGIEIKRDMRLVETGNAYIEYQERLNNYGEWINSGILKVDNSRYFLLGDIDGFYIFRRHDLLDLYVRLIEGNQVPNGVRLVGATRGTSLGFLIPRAVANGLSLTIDNVVAELG